MDEGIKKRFRLFSTFLALLSFALFSLSACKNEVSELGGPLPTELGIRSDGESTDPPSYPIGQFSLDGDLIYIQEVDLNEGTALALGLAGAANVAAGVQRVCLQPLESADQIEPVCVSVNADGSFRSGILPNLPARSKVVLWPQADGYDGGPDDPNAIIETVISWHSPWPSMIEATSENEIGLLMGTGFGLYFVWKEHLDLPVDQVPPPIRFTKVDGLIDNCVFTLEADSFGGWWIGTKRGLSHLTLDTFSKPTFTNYPLNHSEIRDIAIDHDGHVWAASNQGLHHLKPVNESYVHSSTYGLSNGWPTQDLTAVVVDAFNQLWIGSSQGLIQPTMEKNELTSIKTYDDEMGSVGYNIHSLLAAYEGRSLIIRTELGLISKSGPNNNPTFHTLPLSQPQDALHRLVPLVDDVQRGMVWTETAEGFTQIAYGPAFFIGRTYSSEISHNRMLSFSNSTNGAIWIGSDLGLTRYIKLENLEAKFLNYRSSQGLPKDGIRALLPEPDGSLWVGSHAGLTYIHPEPTGSEPFSFKHIQDKPDYTYSLTRQNPHTILAGGNWHLTQVEKKNNGKLEAEFLTAPFSNIQALTTDSMGRVWAAAGESFYQLLFDDHGNYVDHIRYRWKVENTLAGTPNIHDIVEDHAGGLWLATESGVSHFTLTASDHSLDHYSPFVIPENFATSVVVDSLNRVWFGSLKGLHVLTLGGNDAHSFQTFTTSSGLPGNEVWALKLGDDQTLWVGTDRGLVHFDLTRLESPILDVFTADSGLTNENIRVIKPHPQGALWLGTVGGLMLFNP